MCSDENAAHTVALSPVSNFHALLQELRCVK